jgi:hypothetical protein
VTVETRPLPSLQNSFLQHRLVVVVAKTRYRDVTRETSHVKGRTLLAPIQSEAAPYRRSHLRPFWLVFRDNM